MAEREAQKKLAHNAHHENADAFGADYDAKDRIARDVKVNTDASLGAKASLFFAAARHQGRCHQHLPSSP